MAAEDGTLYELRDGVASEQAQPEPEPEPEPRPEPEPEPDPEPEPRPEPEPEPDPEPEPEHKPEPEPEAPGVPGFVEYSPSDLPRYALAAVFVVAVVAAVLTLFAGNLVPAVLLAAVAALAWFAVLRWASTVVSIRDGVLEVAGGTGTSRFDLCDPETHVEIGSNTGSPSWTTRVRDADAEAVVRRHQVKVRQFVQIVEHHRAHPRPESDDEADTDEDADTR